MALDYFALLDEPRRPWLDSDSLKKKFLALSTSVHPDKMPSASDSEKGAASKNFAELNTAFNCLNNPKLRLLHLLELELDAKPKDIQQIPNDLANIFADVSMACSSADRFLAEKAKVTSPLLQVQLFERGQEWVEKLNALQKRLAGFQEQLLTELKSLDAKWMAGDSQARTNLLKDLENLYRLFSYFNRWNGQIHERIVQLSL
jgi:curved DNA-binding protein CbpA